MCLIFAVGLDREIFLTAKFSRSTVRGRVVKTLLCKLKIALRCHVRVSQREPCRRPVVEDGVSNVCFEAHAATTSMTFMHQQ